MSYPTLTPASQLSAVVLPSTGSTSLVADSLPYGMYTGSVDFLSGASEQVAYTFKKLGGDVLDIELTAGNVYAAYEEAVLEYSYIINIHQSKNVLSDLLGSTTGSFDHQGRLVSGDSLSGSNQTDRAVALKYPKYTLSYERRVSDGIAQRAGLGGDRTEYSASFSTQSGQQDYDLQKIVADATGELFTDKVNEPGKKIRIKKVFFKTPHAMWRFFGYYGGINTVGNMSSYGMYADDSTFELIPAWHNKLQAMQFEDNIWTRVSHYSYELKDNNIRIYPKPSSVSPSQIWFQFTIDENPWEEDSTRQSGTHGINNMNTLPFENIPYKNINAIGKQWIRRFALALTKEILGQVRSKFAAIPIPGESLTLNGPALIAEGREEQDKLREELKTTLDELTYAKLMEKDASITDTARAIQEKVPLPIIVG